MAQQHINTGSDPNDFTGDPLRTAFKKTEDNFIELYGFGAASFPVTASATSPTEIVGGPNGEAATLGITGSLSASLAISASFIATDNIISSQNPNTKIEFLDKKINIYVDNQRHILCDAASLFAQGVQINPDNNDIDTLIHGTNGSTPAIFVDAGNMKIGIKTESPTKDFEVNGDIKANEYFGDITTGDPNVAGQHFQIQATDIISTADPNYYIVCVSQG
jgi:hypothetical protein